MIPLSVQLPDSPSYFVDGKVYEAVRREQEWWECNADPFHLIGLSIDRMRAGGYREHGDATFHKCPKCVNREENEERADTCSYGYMRTRFD